MAIIPMNATAEVKSDTYVHIDPGGEHSFALELEDGTYVSWDWGAVAVDPEVDPNQHFYITDSSGQTLVSVSETNHYGEAFVTEEDEYTFTWETEVEIFLEYSITYDAPPSSGGEFTRASCCGGVILIAGLLAVAGVVGVFMKKK